MKTNLEKIMAGTRQCDLNDHTIQKCLICDSEQLDIKPAVISGFLIERIWNNSIEKETAICHCQKCGFAFYARRPEESEMEKLYKKYEELVC
jgi:hypothetical protein